MLIVLLPLGIHLPNQLPGLHVGQLLLLHLALNSLLLRRADEHGEDVRVPVAQHIVSAAPHEDAALPLGDAADLVALELEKHLRSGKPPGDVMIPLVHRLEQVGIGGLFICRLQGLDSQLAVLTGQIEQMLFVHFDVQLLGQAHRNLMAAAAERSANTNDLVSHF